MPKLVIAWALPNAAEGWSTYTSAPWSAKSWSGEDIDELKRKAWGAGCQGGVCNLGAGGADAVPAAVNGLQVNTAERLFDAQMSVTALVMCGTLTYGSR